jgi:hypothetical protein
VGVGNGCISDVQPISRIVEQPGWMDTTLRAKHFKESPSASRGRTFRLIADADRAQGAIFQAP